MNKRFGLDESIISQVHKILEKHPQIEQVIIYGSRAKGNYRKGSDIDITLLGGDLDIRILHQIELEIDDLLLPYIFDISIFSQIENNDLIDHINRVGQIFFSGRKNNLSTTNMTSILISSKASSPPPLGNQNQRRTWKNRAT